VGICQRAGGGGRAATVPHVACCKLAPAGGGGHWVIWVIWVTVLNCKLAPVAIVIGSFGSFVFC